MTTTIAKDFFFIMIISLNYLFRKYTKNTELFWILPFLADAGGGVAGAEPHLTPPLQGVKHKGFLGV